MAFQPPLIMNMQTGAGYALQFGQPHPSIVALLRTAGECYVQPVFTKPSVNIATTDSVDNIAAGTRTITVGSITGIAVGTVLTIDQGTLQEQVIVTAVSGSTFTALFAKAHNGLATPFAITGLVFPTAPTGTPAPSAGQPAMGWWHFSITGEKRSLGLEGMPAAGSPFFAGAAGDLIYGVLIWCVTASELEISGH